MSAGARPGMGFVRGGLHAEILRRFALGRDSIHGPSHWGRVATIGRRLAQLTGADPDVVVLFSVLHDSCRMNEHRDPDHGRRGAKLAERLRGVCYELDDARTELLLEACRDHADGLTSPNITIGACWDADRLDLVRVGIQPDPEMLSTDAAREPAVMTWAASLWRDRPGRGG
jgi:uncharacterized protein